MTEPANEIQRAVADVALFRQAIDHAHRRQQQSAEGARLGLNANLIIQAVALTLALAMIVFELIMDHPLSWSLMATTQFTQWRMIVLVDVGILLVLLVAVAYFVVWRASRRSQRDFTTFVEKNFNYLRNLSLVSDLVVKFAALCLLVLAARPQWIASLLCLFIGDYLIQGRLFSLPLRSSLLLGVLCMAAGVGLFVLGVQLLFWPLLLFVAVDAASIVVLLRLRLSATRSSEAA